MEELKRKLGYTSFAELSADELSNCLKLIRNVKLLFSKCAKECYSQQEVALDAWKNTRNECISSCKQPHDAIADIFVENYSKIRDTCVKCVLDSSTEYPVTKSGEEDLRIDEEKCYEKMFYQVKALRDQLDIKYQEIYLDEFVHDAHQN